MKMSEEVLEGCVDPDARDFDDTETPPQNDLPF